MTATLPGAFQRGFLGNAPAWYKATVAAFLVLNPLIAWTFGPVAAGWAVLLEFIFTLAMALRCYPLQPGGLIAIEAVVMRLTTGESVYEEVVQALP
jgi:NhaB family Na+:H+ antiporter